MMSRGAGWATAAADGGARELARGSRDVGARAGFAAWMERVGAGSCPPGGRAEGELNSAAEKDLEEGRGVRREEARWEAAAVGVWLPGEWAGVGLGFGLGGASEGGRFSGLCGGAGTGATGAECMGEARFFAGVTGGVVPGATGVSGGTVTGVTGGAVCAAPDGSARPAPQACPGAMAASDSPAAPASGSAQPTTGAQAEGATAGVGEGGRVSLPESAAESSPGEAGAEDMAVTEGRVGRNQVGNGVSQAREGGEEVNSARGISTAQQESAMQKAAPMQQFTGLKEQELPGTPLASPANPTIETQGIKTVNLHELATAAAVTSLGGASRTSETETAFLNADSGDIRGAGRSLERTHDLVSLHALRLRDSSADTLRVVIRPGPGMQLALDLHLRDGGGVDVRASLNRGDYEFLSTHWSELQHQLEPRGVRLAALNCTEPRETTERGFAHSRQRQDDAEAEAEAFAGLPFVGAVAAPARPALATAGRGWQSWA